jgi:hypothetical protein
MGDCFFVIDMVMRFTFLGAVGFSFGYFVLGPLIYGRKDR